MLNRVSVKETERKPCEKRSHNLDKYAVVKLTVNVVVMMDTAQSISHNPNSEGTPRQRE